MKPEFECAVTSSFLRSGRTLCNVSNCAAILAGVGMLLTHLAAARGLFGASMLCWPITTYLGVRVAIDASLFRDLANDPADGGRALDDFLRDRGLLRARPERTLAERSRGAFKLGIRLMIAVAIQMALLAVALGCEALAS